MKKKYTYTNLHDKHGSLIKKGDILEVPAKDGFLYLVNYDKKTKEFSIITTLEKQEERKKAEEAGEDVLPSSFLEGVCVNTIIIDNVFDNPNWRRKFYDESAKDK